MFGQLLQLDHTSTKRTPFTRPPISKAKRKYLPLLAWCAGRKMLAQPEKNHVIWNKVGGLIEIRDSVPGQGALNPLVLRVRQDVASLQVFVIFIAAFLRAHNLLVYGTRCHCYRTNSGHRPGH